MMAATSLTMFASAAQPLSRTSASTGGLLRLTPIARSRRGKHQAVVSSNINRSGARRDRRTLKTPAATDVEGATEDYCDESVCKTSPQVEETVRSLAKDIELVRWSQRLFQGEVKYGDKFRNFQGRDNYARSNFIQETVENPKATIKSMKMVDIKSSVIVWQLTGTVAGQNIDVEFTDKFEHNQLTGRVITHEVTWNASAGSIAFNTSRAAWSASEAQKDLGNLVNKTLDELSFSEDDDASMDSYRDPSDPTKFFNQKPDDGTNDMIQYALFLAVLYLVYQTYSQLNQL